MPRVSATYPGFLHWSHSVCSKSQALFFCIYQIDPWIPQTFRFFCQRNGFLLALRASCKRRGHFDLNMFVLSFQREVCDLFSSWGWKKAVLRRPRNVNMLLVKWRKVDHIGTMSVCQLLKSCSTCMCKGGVAARCLGSLWTPPFLLPIISIRTHSVVS